MERPKFPIRQALFFTLLVLFIYSYIPEGAKGYKDISGTTMGTTYKIRFLPPQSAGEMRWKEKIDQLLIAINQSMSTYIPDSEISLWNSNQSTALQKMSPELLGLVKDSLKYSDSTSGLFDITVGKLVNLWGFGPLETLKRPLEKDLKNALVHTGYELLVPGDGNLGKKFAEVEIDLSAIAKGYGVDQVSLFLEKEGVEHYLVEIGGEIRTRGNSSSGSPWKVGISKPLADSAATELVEAVMLGSGSLATSGDYRNFHQDESGKWSHFIDPIIGYPRKSDLLSATILAETCQEADALATIAMLLGSVRAREYLDQRNVHYLLILGTRDGFDFLRSKGWDQRKL